MSVEKSVTLARSGIATVDEGLTWVVQQLDKEFSGATMVKIELEQMQVLDEGADEWRYEWGASVHGLVEESP